MKTPLSHHVPRHLTIALLAGAALTACAGAQSAQSQPRQEPKKEAKLKGALDQPLGARAAGGGQNGNVRVIMNSSDDSGSYTITINNDEISAEADGQPVPPDRIERKGDVVIIKDKNGKALKTFDVGQHGAHAWIADPATGAFTPFGSGGGQWMLSPDFQGATAFSGAFEPPPVMVGITMTEAEQSVIEELGVEADEVFVIDRVIEGLPASDAGIQPNDVVIRINGKKPASQERFRETLKDKKPGDKIELTIVRKGKEQIVPIKLMAFDQSKLGQFGGYAGIPQDADAVAPQRRPLTLNWSGDQGVTAEARKRIEEALKSIRDNPDLKADKMRQRAEEALEQALKSLEQSKDALAQRYYQFRSPRGGAGQGDVIVGDRPGQFFRVPADPSQPGQDRDVARRMERLSEMLERLDKRLDDIEKRLDKTSR